MPKQSILTVLIGNLKIDVLSYNPDYGMGMGNATNTGSNTFYYPSYNPPSAEQKVNKFILEANVLAGQGGKPGFNIDNAVDYLNDHAYAKYDKATCGRCARAVRLSLEAGGINTSNRPNSAKDYGPYLQKWGFSTVDRTYYSPLKGDLRVFQNYTGGSIHGHIDMYNGGQWVSDFFENGFWPGRGYRENNAAFTIYRWGD